MLTGIDHLVVAVPDVDAAAAELEAAVGLRATGGGRHPGQGTLNRLVWFGDSYLELIGVEDTTLAASSWIGRPTLAVLDRSSDGGLATWAIAKGRMPMAPCSRPRAMDRSNSGMAWSKSSMK